MDIVTNHENKQKVINSKYEFSDIKHRTFLLDIYIFFKCIIYLYNNRHCKYVFI